MTQMPPEQFQVEYNKIVEKDCLCEGLTVSVLLKDELPVEHRLTAVSICPGPNLAYFSGIYSLQQMVGHIYGRISLLNSLPRPHMFVNELQLYIDYLHKTIEQGKYAVNAKQNKYYSTFKENLLKGVEYHKTLLSDIKNETAGYLNTMSSQLEKMQKAIANLPIPLKNEAAPLVLA